MSTGEVEIDNYEILQKLGEGGSSDVYLARQKTLDRKVVLKVLKTNTLNKRSIIRFQNEAKALSKLNHPNIASVYDFGQSKSGDLYLSIEFVDGIDLSALISRQGEIPLDDAIDIAIQLCRALDHAHKVGIVHRDIKPANIMITDLTPGKNTDEHQSLLNAKLLDFGISKLTEDATGFGASITDSGEAAESSSTFPSSAMKGAVTTGSGLIGSPLFMSPEQCQGKPTSKFSDHYSLGCVLYNMLCGKPTFHGELPTN